MFFPFLMACMGNKSTTITTESGVTVSIHGTAPSETIPAPDFVAYNHDGAERNAEAFMGHPTVIWFYPAANTPG